MWLKNGKQAITFLFGKILKLPRVVLTESLHTRSKLKKPKWLYLQFFPSPPRFIVLVGLQLNAQLTLGPPHQNTSTNQYGCFDLVLDNRPRS